MTGGPAPRAPRLVTLGGRSGPCLLLEALRGAGWEVTALVATTDSGSSTGRIREEFGLPAPGDIRSVLAAAADLPAELQVIPALLEHRFRPVRDAGLGNMALGNLLLVALAERLGDFERGVGEAARLLRCWAAILPVPSQPTTLCARLADGSRVRGEVSVRAPGKPRIAELCLEPAEARVPAAAVQAIREADLVVLGPGGLFCSVLPPILPGPIRAALAGTPARLVYVCNTTTQPGQTDGFGPAEHVAELVRLLGAGRLDYVLLNGQPPPAEAEAAYRQDGVHFMPVTPAELRRIRELGPVPVVGDFLEEGWRGKRTLHKLDTIRHDPAKVGGALRGLLEPGAAR